MPPTFLDIPLEVVSEIMYQVAQVAPDDIDNCALTSKHFYFALTPMLAEHRRLKRQYTVISHSARHWEGDDWEDLSPVHHLPHLLKTVIQCPRIGLYVKKIIVRGIEENWVTDEDPGTDSVLNPRYSEDDMGLFKRTASRYPILYCPSSSWPDLSLTNMWNRDMEYGNHTAVLVLILLHCPNLSSFACEDRGNPSQLVPDLFRDINLDEDCNLLSQLRDFRFEHSAGPSGPWYADINRIKPLLGLPAIESMEACGLRAFHEVGAPMPYRSSNIHSLTFIQCMIHDKSFFELLEAIGQLKSLTLHKTNLDGYWIRAALMAFAKGSLEYLSLHHNTSTNDARLGHYDDCGPDYIGPLQPFTVLQIVDLDHEILKNPEYGDIRDLEAHLPASLQSLTLDLGGCELGDLESELKLMMNANAKKRAFSHLRQIILIDPDEGDDETLRQVREVFAKQEVQLYIE
ncbi:MAG: hypothetical protein Q9221_001228 [Calogaya cf. arnoldii]